MWKPKGNAKFSIVHHMMSTVKNDQSSPLDKKINADFNLILVQLA